MLRLNLRSALLAFALLLVSSFAAADVLDEITDKRVIRFGVAEFAPWTIRTKSGNRKTVFIWVGRGGHFHLPGVFPKYTAGSPLAVVSCS